MSTVTTLGVVLHLEGACRESECSEFAFPLYSQLSSGYETCSVLKVPESTEDWRSDHRTARKRANHAANLGYQFREIEREHYAEDIFEINTSRESRQGRRMTQPYRERQNYVPLPEYPCELHAVYTYGVIDAHGTLASYLWLYRSGDLALVSSILGHAEHEPKDVMYLLFQGVVEAQAPLDGYLVYNRHDSGTDGLRYFKEKLGFAPMEVAWEL